MKNKFTTGVSSLGWLLSVSQSVTTGVPIFLSLLLADSKSPGTVQPFMWGLISVPVLIAFCLSLNREYRTKRDRRLEIINSAVEKADFENIVMQTLGFLVDDLQDRRANVMVIQDKSPQALITKYFHGDSGESPDKNIEWEKFVGCCGKAWGVKKQYFLDLSQLSEEDLRIQLNMSPQQIACTKGLGAVVSTPLRDTKDRNTIIGVLNCDSKKPLSESGFTDIMYLKAFDQHAEIISKLITFLKEVNDGDSKQT
jgi:hypothetical protein